MPVVHGPRTPDRSQAFAQKKSRAKRATPKNRHRNMAAHSKISQLLTIIEWLEDGGTGSGGC